MPQECSCSQLHRYYRPMSIFDRTLDRFRAVPKAPLATGQGFHDALRTVGAKITLSQDEPDPRDSYPTQMKLGGRDVTFTPSHDHHDGEAVISTQMQWTAEGYAYRLRGGEFPGERSVIIARSLAASFGDTSEGRVEIDSDGRVVKATGVLAERGAIRDRIAPVIDELSRQGAEIERIGGPMAAARLEEDVATIRSQMPGGPEISAIDAPEASQAAPELSDEARPGQTL